MSEDTVPTDEQKQDPLAAFKAQETESKSVNAMLYPNYSPYRSPCPSCGHCPSCGRGGHTIPWNPYPSGPWIFGGPTWGSNVTAAPAPPYTLINANGGQYS